MKQKTKVVFASTIGNALEMYDFTLYGIFTPVLSLLFFPTSDPQATLLAALVALAAGYFARPLGAIVFGHLGDKIGRKKVLSFSIILMAIATTGIGLLPTYDAIGFLAPCSVVICRLLQGLCAGGEMNGAAIFLLEHSKRHQVNLASALVFFGGGLGSLIAALCGGIFLHPSMPEWAWRIPFFLGGCIGRIGLYIRHYMNESPEFQQEPAAHILKYPLLTAVREHFLPMLRCLSCGGLSGALAAALIIYMNIYLSEIVGIPINQAMFVTTFGLGCYIFLVLIVGLTANKIGRLNFMRIGSMGIIVGAYPVFYFVQTALPINFLVAEFILAICSACFVAPLNAFMNELLPVNMRYSGIAASYCIGFAIFGGLMPVLSTILLNIKGNLFAPAFYLITAGCVGFFATLHLK